MKFFTNLLSAKSDISSKRFISLYCLVLFTVVVVCALFQIKVESEIVYGIISLILGTSSMTLISNNSNKSKGLDDNLDLGSKKINEDLAG